jgi:anti-sigma-K factor RskA
MMRSRAVLVVALLLASSLAPPSGHAQDAEPDAPVVVAAEESTAPRATPSPAAAGARAGEAQDEPWLVGLIAGAIVAVGVGVAIAVIASQQSLEPPLPGTEGTVELLRF